MKKYGIELRVKIPSVEPEEIERAEAAAWEVFEEAGINPWACAAAAFKLEGELEFNDAGDMPQATAEELELVMLWKRAISQAGMAYCGAEEFDVDVDFELVRDGPPYESDLHKDLRH